MINKLYREMINYYKEDTKRIQHFIKVHSLAKLIGEEEKLDKEQLEILEAAALVHDIGIKPAEKKYGSCSGRLQEQEGTAPAREMLESIGFGICLTDRVCFLVSHHHTYTNINTMDYQILVEADFLVNLYEDNTSKKAVKEAYNRIFKTKTGKEICKAMFGI